MRFFAAIAHLFLALHAHRMPAATNYYVGPECHITARMSGCDHDSPPHCQKAIIRLRQGLRRLEAAK
jgi:hypothetical protein